MFASFGADVRHAARALRRSPAYSLAVMLTLAIGIGATSTLFSIVNAVIINPLPYPDADRIVSLSMVNKGEDEQVAKAHWIRDWAQQARTLDAVVAYGTTSGALSGSGEATEIKGVSVTPEFFRVMRVQPARGRAFDAADAEVADDVAPIILSHAFWRDRFGADTTIIGRSLVLDGHARPVIGIMPEGFSAPSPNRSYWEPMKMQFPAPVTPKNPTYFVRYYFSLARVKPDVSLEDVRQELTTIARQSDRREPAGLRDTALTPSVVTFHDRLYGPAKKPVFLLGCAVAFLLFIACANVANLSLARAAVRERDYAVRRALGAERWRLVRYTLVESLLLAGAGAVLGMSVPYWTLPIILRYPPPELTRVTEIPVTGSVLVFTTAVAVITGLVFGLFPSVAAASTRALTAFRPASSRVAGSSAQRRMRQVLIVAQIAVAIALMTGAGLLARSLSNVMRLETGFRGDKTFSGRIYLPDARYQNNVARRAFFEQVGERLRNNSAVAGFAYTSGAAPVTTLPPNITTRENGRELSYAFTTVSADYPRVAGLIPLAGTMFAPGRTNGVMLSASAAKMFFPDRDAVGETVKLSEHAGGEGTVIGVVADMAGEELVTHSAPLVYRAFAGKDDAYPYVVVVRPSGTPQDAMAAIRKAVADVDPMQAVSTLTTAEEALQAATGPRRMSTGVLSTFAMLAIVLAAVGLYGVMAYQLERRRREFGIRLALGAQGSTMLRLVFSEGMALAGIGIVLGSLVAFAISRIMSGLLYGVTTHDPVAFALAPAVLAVVAAVVSYMPARRAARVDPMEALREE